MTNAPEESASGAMPCLFICPIEDVKNTLNQVIITPQLFSLVSFGLLIGFQFTSHKFLVH